MHTFSNSISTEKEALPNTADSFNKYWKDCSTNTTVLHSSGIKDSSQKVDAPSIHKAPHSPSTIPLLCNNSLYLDISLVNSNIKQIYSKTSTKESHKELRHSHGWKGNCSIKEWDCSLKSMEMVFICNWEPTKIAMPCTVLWAAPARVAWLQKLLADSDICESSHHWWGPGTLHSPHFWVARWAKKWK